MSAAGDNSSSAAINSRNLAESYMEKRKYGRALWHLLISVKLNPDWKDDLRETLSAILCKLGEMLEHQGRYDDLFKCYEEAIEVFPDNELILNNLGSLLLKYGLIKEAVHYFRKSLNVRPYFLRAYRNLENVSNLVVGRWHFRMLNDSKRNGAFREAIIKKVNRGYDTVLDIGTGTGILSLFAVEAGAKKVHACDLSPYMIEIANRVMEENGIKSVNLKCKDSADLKIPDDIPERVKLVVTEIFDCGLLGEHVLETLVDAWDRLLLPRDSAIVLPIGATVYVVGVECEALRRKNFPNCNKSIPNFDNCRMRIKADNYDSESLRQLPGVRYMTNVYKSNFVDFNDPIAMRAMLDGNRDENVFLNCSESGRIDSLVVWFDLHVDEEIVLSTAPDSVLCESWDQAIFPVPDELSVDAGDLIRVRMRYGKGKISFREFATTKPNPPESDFVYKYPGYQLVQMINSEVHSNRFAELTDAISRKFPHGVSILDNYPFPVFGFGYLLRRRDPRNVLTCVMSRSYDREFMKFLVARSDLKGRIRFIDEDHMWKAANEIGKFNLIMLNLIESTGELNDDIIPNLDTIRSCLKHRGLMMPECVTVMGMLVESEWLERMSRIINDDVTLGYRIGNFINSYQVNSHIDFSLKGIPYESRTEPFELCKVAHAQFRRTLKVPVTRPGSANALVYWFRINFLAGVPEITTLDDSVSNQSALLFPKRTISDEVELTLIFDHGLFRLDNF